MEIELKLKLRPSDSARLRDHPMLAQHAVAGPTEHRHTDTYYDTPEYALWHHGLTLRVRAEDGRYIQTVKTDDGPGSALHRRGEWECRLVDEVAQPGLLAREIKPARLAKLLASPQTADRLQAVFSGTTRRTTWDLHLSSGGEIACALDIGACQAEGQRTKFAELELELKHGPPDGIFDFALALHRDIPLELANDSKAARGYALLGSSKAAAIKAKPVSLRNKTTLREAFHSIGLNCLQQMEANVGGVLAKDVESLHQLRVGLRRLRALLDMFGPRIIPPHNIGDGLDWLAAELGSTRDWDVLADSTLTRVHGIDPSALRDSARAKAAKLHEVMLKNLQHPRFTALLLQLNAWLRSSQWQHEPPVAGDADMAKPAARAALPLLRKAERRLSKRIAALDRHDAPARHRVRIAAKKARYSAEFFRDLLDRKNVNSYIIHLSALQDQLGLLNDMAVAERLLPELEHGSSEDARAARYARGFLCAASEADIEELGPVLKKIAQRRMTRHT